MHIVVAVDNSIMLLDIIFRARTKPKEKKRKEKKSILGYYCCCEAQLNYVFRH